MKFKFLSVGLFSLTVVSPLFAPSFTRPASALGCVITDVAVQVDVSGSKTPAQQTHNPNQQFGEDCTGNSVTNTATQVNTGPNSAQQNVNSNSVVGGGATSNTPGKGDVGVKVHVPVDVYNPAADPNFLNGVGVPKR
ncbi:hypothetical protein [Fischerella thermalis]|uniref:hypothetical protein n=1 Tax=Fischerella thermalis TaxID=372787 RepID=UPI000C80B7DB|nr:hypothetical protein [Fischerella thermalis]MBF1990693.1 hypothetical protein [Fischerella thermalis M58_A2018_009]MBF2061849.1 hypothetical protein [Fischerella thermalis M66_A2018_004]MBF2071256.1 hypothetical protein [Fischerella thermalis M48_A2018_028]PLZ94081.1 hypothetical protein CI593_01300 [Fischerella thermalis CCMEE 5194]